MNRLATLLADALVAGGARDDKRDIYIYALEAMLSVLLMVSVFCIIGIAFSSFAIILCWQIALMALRMPMGGYHASTHMRCQLLSCALALLCVVLVPHLSRAPLAAIALCAATLVIAWVIAPVVHPNQPQSAKERRRARTISVGVAAAEVVAVVALLAAGQATLATAIALGGASASIPGLYAKLANRRDPEPAQPAGAPSNP